MAQVLNVCLVPEESYYSKLVQYSQTIHKIQTSLYVLGEKSIPHASVVLGEFPEDINLSELQKSLKPILGKSYSVDVEGLRIVPETNGNIWLDLYILKSNLLVELQSEILKIVGKQVDIWNGIGDRYRPHFTVGLFQNEIKQMFPLDTNLMKIKAITCKVILGISGENCQLAETVA